MTQRGGEHPAFSELAGPRNDVLTAVLGAFGPKQRVGIRFDGNGLVQLVAGSAPFAGEELGDRAVRVQFDDGEGLVGVMHLGPHAATGLPIPDLRRLPECVDGAVDHDGGFSLPNRAHGVVEHDVGRFVEAEVVGDGIIPVGEPRILDRKSTRLNSSHT